MKQPSSSVSNDNAVGGCVPNTGYGSTTQLRCAPGSSSLAADLPERVLVWLHDGLEAVGAWTESERVTRVREFEAAVVARLFPFEDPRSFVVRLYEHCRATAIAARVVAEHARLSSPDTSYVVGLLHDMGIAVSLQRLDPRTYFTDNEAFRRVWPSLLDGSRVLGSDLASTWRLPNALRQALRQHQAPGAVRPLHPIAAASFTAEHLAGCLGYGFLDEQPTTGLRLSLQALGLSERELSPLGRRTEQALTRELWPWPRARCSSGT